MRPLLWEGDKGDWRPVPSGGKSAAGNHKIILDLVRDDSVYERNQHKDKGRSPYILFFVIVLFGFVFFFFHLFQHG